MKNYSKILTITLGIFLLITNVLLTSAYANDKGLSNKNTTIHNKTRAVDITPPKLDINSIKIDKKNVKKSDTINITLKASDDISGISGISVYYTFPESSKLRRIMLEYNSSNDSYCGSLKIDDNMENGTWSISCIYLTDEADNSNYIHSYDYDLSSLNFNVSGNVNIDNTPPTLDLNSLKIDKREGKNGDIINISLKASDDISGISNIKLCYITPITSKKKCFSLGHNSSTNTYDGTIKIDDKMENGIWTVYSIDLYDWANNFNNMSSHNYDFSTLSFNVFNNENVDITSPTIDMNSLKVDKKNVKAGDTINIDLKAYDDISGIAGVEICYTSPHTYKSKSILLKYNSSTNSYYGSLNIDDTMEYGTWTIYYIDLFDNAFNNNYMSYYDYDFSSLSFNVLKPDTITYAEEDLNEDGYTNITDLSLLANNYNKTSKSSGWNSKLDLNKDGIIDIYDIVRVSSKIEN